MWLVPAVVASAAAAFISTSSSPNQGERTSGSNPTTQSQKPSHSADARSESQGGRRDMGSSSPRQVKPVLESSTTSQKASPSATTRSQSKAARALEAEKEGTAPPPASQAKQTAETATTPMPQRTIPPSTTRLEAEASIIPNKPSTRSNPNPSRAGTANPSPKPLYTAIPSSELHGSRVAETRKAYLAPSPPNQTKPTTRSTATSAPQKPSQPVATRPHAQATKALDNSPYHNGRDGSPAVARNVPNPVSTRSVETQDFRAPDTGTAVHSSGVRVKQQHLDTSHLQRIQELEQLVRQRENEITSLKALNLRTSEKPYRYDSQIRHLQDKIDEQEITLQNTQELLDVKTKELAAANAFLTLTDGAAVADACRELETLNSEIFQFAALISESLTFDCTERSPVSGEAQRILGHPLHKVLLDADADCIILAVQVSIQVVLSTLCSDVISSWCVPKEDFSNDLKKLYEYFHHQGPARIAGTWRSLTRSRVSLADSFDFIHNGLVEQFVGVIAEVLLLAGWSRSPSLAQKTLLADHKPRIADICSAALKLNKMIGELITSVDLDILHIQGEEAFNSSLMTDMYEESEGDKTHVVLGTTELGMIQRERQGASARLMLPKVVLLATFQD